MRKYLRRNHRAVLTALLALEAVAAVPVAGLFSDGRPEGIGWILVDWFIVWAWFAVVSVVVWSLIYRRRV